MDESLFCNTSSYLVSLQKVDSINWNICQNYSIDLLHQSEITSAWQIPAALLYHGVFLLSLPRFTGLQVCHFNQYYAFT